MAFGLTHEQGFKVSVLGLRAEGLGYQMSKNMENNMEAWAILWFVVGFWCVYTRSSGEYL